VEKPASVPQRKGLLIAAASAALTLAAGVTLGVMLGYVAPRAPAAPSLPSEGPVAAAPVAEPDLSPPPSRHHREHEHEHEHEEEDGDD
jgi:hypothetical protein